jgi:hypothetical protein
MKELSEFILEKLSDKELKERQLAARKSYLIGRDAEWMSIHGGFHQGHVDIMMNDYELDEDYLKDVLDTWDKEFGGTVEWEIKGKKIKFKRPDSSQEWVHDGKKWKEL